MSDTNSTAPATPGKSADTWSLTPDTRATPDTSDTRRPAKPSDDFPLFPHATGRWAKKVKGKMYYFGPWDDPDGALLRYEQFVKTGQVEPAPKAIRPPRRRRRDATDTEAPSKPSPDFPLFAHATGRWAKKIDGKLRYFAKWDDPDGALREYQAFLAGDPVPKPPSAQPHSDRPSKPSPDFPLFAHATGRWAKKIRGQVHYFGPWDDPDGALTLYNEQKDALHAGRKPRENADALTVKGACNAFLRHKKDLKDAGELSPHTWAKYKTAAETVIAQFTGSRLVTDLDAQDFAALRRHMAKRWGVYRLGDMIQHVRSIFKYAADADLIERPVRFGPGFARPSKHAQRLHRAEQGPKLFTANEVRQMIDGATVNVRAMLLLGINCAFGNADCGNLPLSAVDLDRGMIDYPRPKTGIARRCPLWPETVQALREVLAHRPAPKREADAGLFFLTRLGQSWAKEKCTSPLVLEVSKLLKKLGINGRKRLGFYTLRHVFRTVADEAKDQPATDHIMGHEVASMSSVYRETISDERLKAVSDHVRAWLFPVGSP